MLGYADEKGSYRELIEFISIALLVSYEEAHDLLSKKDLLSSDLNENSKRLLKKAKAVGSSFTVVQAGSWISGVSHQTVRNRLNELVELECWNPGERPRPDGTE